VGGGPGRAVLGEPLPRDYLEAVGNIIDASLLLSLPMLPRINAAGQELARGFPALTSVLQTNIRIHAKGETLFFPIEAILQPPPFASCWRYFKVESALVGGA
jgi:hypothetical protein